MTPNQSAGREPSPDGARRQAAAWLASALLLPLLAACKTTGASQQPTKRPERWPPGGR